MSIYPLDCGLPFFRITLLKAEAEYQVSDRAVLLNLSNLPLHIQDHTLGYHQAATLIHTTVYYVENAVLIEPVTPDADPGQLLNEAAHLWSSQPEATAQESVLLHGPEYENAGLRLRLYAAQSAGARTDLSKNPPPCEGHNGHRIYLQLLGLGKIQQFANDNISSLYREDALATGGTHAPLFDENGLHPWHRYEALSPGFFMAIETTSL